MPPQPRRDSLAPSSSPSEADRADGEHDGLLFDRFLNEAATSTAFDDFLKLGDQLLDEYPMNDEQQRGDDQLSLIMSGLEFDAELAALAGGGVGAHPFEYGTSSRPSESSSSGSDSGKHSPTSSSSGEGVSTWSFPQSFTESAPLLGGGVGGGDSAYSTDSSPFTLNPPLPDVRGGQGAFPAPPLPPGVSSVPTTIPASTMVYQSTASSSHHQQQYHQPQPLLLTTAPSVSSGNRLVYLVPSKPGPITIQKQSTSSRTQPYVPISPVMSGGGGRVAVVKQETGVYLPSALGVVSTVQLPPPVAASPGVADISRKREDRKQKNRAAAQLSRIRKKEEMDHLHSTVDSLRAENASLRNENELLKTRLARYEDPSLPDVSRVSQRRRPLLAAGGGACVMVMCMMVVFGGGGGGGVGLSPLRSSPPLREAAHPVSRALLSTDYEQDYELAPVDISNSTLNGTGCGQAAGWNTTETRRLNAALDSWVHGHEKLEWLRMRRGGATRGGAKEPAAMGEMLKPVGEWMVKNSQARVAVESEEEGGRVSKAASNATTATRTNATATAQTVRPAQSGAPLRRGGPAAAVQRKKNATRPLEGGGAGEKAVKSNLVSAAAKREAAKQRAIRDRSWRHLDMITEGNGRERDSREKQRRLARLEKTSERTLDVGGSSPPYAGLSEAEAKARYDQMTRSLQQRADTLYVVAMQDYFLLPSVSRDSLARPRMSLILPAKGGNGTSEGISMMRIDCEVTGTGLFNLADIFIPLFAVY